MQQCWLKLVPLCLKPGAELGTMFVWVISVYLQSLRIHLGFGGAFRGKIGLKWHLSSKFHYFDVTIMAKIGFSLFGTWSTIRKYVCMDDFGLFLKFGVHLGFWGSAFRVKISLKRLYSSKF